VACHTCDGVVENDNSGNTFVIYHIDESCYAGVNECGIADYCNHIFSVFPPSGLFHAVCHADAGTHAYAIVNRVEGS